MLFNIIVKIKIAEVPRWTVESVEMIYCWGFFFSWMAAKTLA